VRYNITSEIFIFLARFVKHEDHPPQRRFVLQRTQRKHQDHKERQI